jgi:dTDP-4-dehydrorhamnose 3,5-epimerase
MKIEIESQHLNGLVVLKPEVFEDERGFFLEAFRTDQFRELGLPTEFVQDNHSRSKKGVLRGLHFQWDPPMGKLMRVTYGAAYLMAVDIRVGSPTLGQWFGMEVSAQNKRQIYAPAGFARGFYVLSDFAELQYKCTGIYSNKGEGGIRWDDPEIGIQWPLDSSIEVTLSDKDRKAPTLSEWLKGPNGGHFRY